MIKSNKLTQQDFNDFLALKECFSIVKSKQIKLLVLEGINIIRYKLISQLIQDYNNCFEELSNIVGSLESCSQTNHLSQQYLDQLHYIGSKLDFLFNMDSFKYSKDTLKDENLEEIEEVEYEDF